MNPLILFILLVYIYDVQALPEGGEAHNQPATRYQSVTGSLRHRMRGRFPGFCFHNNRIYLVGQSFPAGDGCNTCSCRHDGVICTLAYCPPTEPSNLECPRIQPGTVGICVDLCSSDSDCPRGQLCCSNGCGHVCMPGVVPTHPNCPRLNPDIRVMCIRAETCPEDGCPPGQECCPSYCGTRCIELPTPCGHDQPLKASDGDQLFCGRGPSRVECPDGSHCVIAPDDSYAVCCPNS